MAMGFLLQIQFIKMAILLVFAFKSSLSTLANFPVAKPGCLDRCGNISIPFPFGTTENCYQHYSFKVTCNQTFNPPKLFMQEQDTSIEITNISPYGQLRVLQFISRDCYTQNGTRIPESSNNGAWISLPKYLTVNNTANRFTIVGCDTYGFVSGKRLDRDYQTGCTAICYAKDDLTQGSCSGLGCCQTSFPKVVSRVETTLKSYRNYTLVNEFNNCSYAFVVEGTEFSFSPDNLTNLQQVEKLPMVVDWAIGNGTCEEAKMNSSTYACKSLNSDCYKPDNGYGYRCSCKDGYEGSPYLSDGCHDIDECQHPKLNICEENRCKNTDGGFSCSCPEGYHGDGEKEGKGCIRGESLLYKLVAGIALGVIVLLLSVCFLYLELKRRILLKTKQKFFLQNGGFLLQERLSERERSPNMAKIFSSSELEMATNKFHDSMIIGQGGYGTVYKGFLADNRVVAIKKSKQVDPNQINQFVNEVIVLSQINHRNVVKLLGCCLDTQVPLLVYEFVSNGTLLEHIHNKAKGRVLHWDLRLRIATETAVVLSYLHSEASTPIVHRDVKSANILLDNNFTAKVADFGSSRLVPVDETQLSTMVQGTFGYLDPEYMQTNQLTEKSDVYSFGVVLVELLTGRKALSYDKPEVEKNLANFFLSVLKQERLFQILDDNVVCEGNGEQLMQVAMIAKQCLNMRGDDRPSMKEVAMELEGQRVKGKHSWAQTGQNAEEMESLLGAGYNGFASGEGNSTSIMYDSIKDHIILPMNGGR